MKTSFSMKLQTVHKQLKNNDINSIEMSNKPFILLRGIHCTWCIYNHDIMVMMGVFVNSDINIEVSFVLVDSFAEWYQE